jgi:hypothetical protein
VGRNARIRAGYYGSKEGRIDMTTTRLTLVVLLVGASTAAPARGQAWAEKMFKDGITHDFGSVPHGAQLFHRFAITNIYAVRMEITGITSGCGCVSAIASKRVLEPRETATLDVSMDARRFTGAKTVAVRVSVGPEFTSSAELKVTANSRADIVFNPGEVSFGAVTAGQTPSQPIDVEYAGGLAWQVTEVVVPKDLPFEVASKELYRRPGQVGYQFKVTLKADAPPGTLKEYFHFKTNDPAAPLVPVLVEATVQTAVTVAPTTITLGVLKAGDVVEKRAVVRGSRPFKVLAVEGLGEGVELKTEVPTRAGEVQTLSFRCEGIPAGGFKRELKIKTDLQEAPVVLTLEGTSEP